MFAGSRNRLWCSRNLGQCGHLRTSLATSWRQAPSRVSRGAGADFPLRREPQGMLAAIYKGAKPPPITPCAAQVPFRLCTAKSRDRVGRLVPTSLRSSQEPSNGRQTHAVLVLRRCVIVVVAERCKPASFCNSFSSASSVPPPLSPGPTDPFPPDRPHPCAPTASGLPPAPPSVIPDLIGHLMIGGLTLFVIRRHLLRHSPA